MDVVQYSIDIVATSPNDMAEIQRVLTEAGYIVKGISWKATWDEEAYDDGKPPKSWD